MADNLSNIDPDINHFDTVLNFQQHSINSFNNKNYVELKTLKIVHHNARSLMKPGRMDEYNMLLQSIKESF